MTARGSRRRAGILALLGGLIVIGALIGAAAATAAEPSETTFGANGIALAGLGPHYVETGFTSVTAGADGGFVAQRNGLLETFLADGTPDPAAPPTAVPKGRQVFPAAGGKSLVLERERLTRLNPDGSRDRSFGGTGAIEPHLIGPDAAVELGSGKIAVIAATVVGPRTFAGEIETTVLNADGSIHRGAAFKRYGLPIERFIGLREIVPMADGGALVVDESFLLELRPDGTVNSAFGRKGLVLTGPLAGARFRSDGSIEAAGQAPGSETGPGLALFRFSATGEPDSSFGSAGVRTFDLGGGHYQANAASWAADGSVVVAAVETLEPCPKEGCETVPVVAAFDAAGDLETGFGEGGALRLTSLTGPSAAYEPHGPLALARRPDGSIVVGGNAPPEETVAFLAGVTPTGRLIPSFGEGGIVRERAAVPAGQALAGIVALPDGTLLAAGSSELGVEKTPVLIRYAADGSLDQSFGGGAGYVTLGPPDDAVYDRPSGFAVDGEVALTSLRHGGRRELLMLGTGDGKPVSTFGTDGAVTLPDDVKVKALAFAANGDPLILAADLRGTKSQPGEVLRYLPDGTLDPSFGQGGKARLRLPGGGAVAGSSLALGAGGTIVIGGQVGGRFALGSLDADGRPDRRFGSGGWTVLRGAGLPAESALATPTGDGSHIYLAGGVGEGAANGVVLMRFDRDGHLDRGFGHGGRLAAPYPRAARPTAIVPGRNGVLVVVDIGPRPLLTFGGGKLRRRAPGKKVQFVREVVGTASGGRLVLAWSHPITRLLAERSYVSDRPLAP